MSIKGDRAIWELETNDIDLLDLTIGDFFDRQIALFQDKVALVYSYPEIGLDLRLTYGQYGAKVSRVAKGLLALGIQKGEQVAVWGPNLPQWLYSQMALAKIGAVLVTINPGYRTHELEYALRQADVTALFMVEELRGNSYLEAIYSLAPELKELSEPGQDRLQSAALPALKGLYKHSCHIGQDHLIEGEMVKLGLNCSCHTLFCLVLRSKNSVTSF